MLVSQADATYVLTAHHVIAPEFRIPPGLTPVQRHYHGYDLKGNVPSKLFALRSRYFKSKSLDLAIVESSLSGYRGADSRDDYFAYADLTRAGNREMFLNDIFVTCDFPAQKLTELPAANEVLHQMLLFFFFGSEGANDAQSKSRYQFTFRPQGIRPDGMSGSPVWLLRERERVDEPITIERLRQRGSALVLQAFFAGIVVEYFKDFQKIAVVRPEACADFASKALPILPSLRLPEEDDWIKDQMGEK